jgi:hypothetical protein
MSKSLTLSSPSHQMATINMQDHSIRSERQRECIDATVITVVASTSHVMHTCAWSTRFATYSSPYPIVCFFSLHLSVRDRCPTGLRSSRCNWNSSEREWVESTQHKSCNEDGKKLLWVQQCGNPGNPQIISLNSLTNNHERYYTFNRKLCGIIRIGIIFLSLFQPEL